MRAGSGVHTEAGYAAETARLARIAAATAAADRASDAAIDADAARHALACAAWGDSLAPMLRRAEYAGITPPTGKTDAGRAARLKDIKFWRRALRIARRREFEAAARAAGAVRKKPGSDGGGFVSDFAADNWRAGQRKAAEFAAEIVAWSDAGDECALADLQEHSQANPALRRAELMVRARGFQVCADAAGHTARVLTITTPSRFHAWKKTGQKNAAWDGSDPRDAQAWLCARWARIRAALARASITVYGFRVAEPHHDATAHWHILLFMPANQAGAVERIAAGHLFDDGEKVLPDARFDCLVVDRRRGDGVGYLAKYITKNIAGADIDCHDETGADAGQAAARVRAWASLWGIRQFQQLGGPPVGIWRELRRIREATTEKTAGDAATLEAARKAADGGQWALFVGILGGIEAGRAGAVELIKEWSDEVNGYGETIGNVIAGVAAGTAAVLTRIKKWALNLAGLPCPWPAPWSPVNNCTPTARAGGQFGAVAHAAGPP